MEHTNALNIIKRSIVRSYAITTRFKLELAKWWLNEMKDADDEIKEQYKEDIQKFKTILKHLPSTLFFKFPTMRRSCGDFPLTMGWYDYRPLICNIPDEDEEQGGEARGLTLWKMDLDYCMLIYEEFFEKFHTHSSKFKRN